MRNIAVILAGGVGRRVGATVPKQFLELCGKTVIDYSLATFNSHAEIDEIAIVTHAESYDRVADIVNNGGYSKVRRLLIGGAERYESSLAAVKAYQSAPCHLLLHDAARPLVSPRIITESVAALASHDAVAVVLPAKDTIYEVDDAHHLCRIPRREHLYHAQTPQSFLSTTIARAYALALSDASFTPTDDLSVVHRYCPSATIAIVIGDEENLKLTTPADISLIENILSKRQQQ